MMRLRQTGLLFCPAPWQKAGALRWLKRTHAWTGFWGAALFLMLGVSGALLNHRSIWKIDTGAARELTVITVPVAADSIADAAALGRWAQQEFSLRTEPRAPRGEGPAAARRGMFMGKERTEPERWMQSFTHPDGTLTVEYIPGSSHVVVRQSAQNAWGLIKNLHKGTGLGLAWVLFVDSIAGALILMSLSGFLLWSNLHGGRLLAGTIAATSLACAAAGVFPYLL